MRRDRRRMHLVGTVALAVACAVGLAACGNSGLAVRGGDVPQGAYRTALDQMVRGYVYEMSCAALLPMAEQYLWDRGFREIETTEGDSLETGWNEIDGEGPIRHEVYARQVGPQQCAVQVIRHRGPAASGGGDRDVMVELELLESIDEQEAQRIRTEARQRARD